jgi:membrane-associated phospholipid phosphatase
LLNKYLITSIVLLSVFIILAIFVSPKLNAGSKDSISIVDNAFFQKIYNSHYLFLDQPMIFLTQYGREAFWILAISVLFVFGGPDGKKTAMVMSMSILVLMLIGNIAKDVVERPRPIIPDIGILIAADTEYAFPSGHAVIVSAGATAALALFRGTTKQLTVSLLLALEAALVCYSRIYVGGHYPLDVLGGILLGVGVTCLFLWRKTEIDLLNTRISNVLKR